MSGISVTELSVLLKSIASLLWPVIASILLLVLWPKIKAIVESALTREFTIKIAGQELTMKPAIQEQQKLIENIEAELIELKRKVDQNVPPAARGELKKFDFTNKDDKALQNSRLSLAQTIKSIVESGLNEHSVEQIQQVIIAQHNTTGCQYHASQSAVEQHIDEINALYNSLMDLLIHAPTSEFSGKVASAFGIMKHNMSSMIHHKAR
jgi:hypothetical protein